MNCPSKTQDSILLDYMSGRLEPGRAALLQAHMLNCPECAGFGREQDAVWNALELWTPEPVSTNFNRTLWRKIDSLGEKPWYRRLADSLSTANWKPAFPLAAAAMLIAAGFVFDHQSDSVAGKVISGPGVTAIEAEQVEQTLDDLQLLHQLDSVAENKQL
jgi:anti-sigma factor RsiW